KGDRICERHECVSPYDAQGAALASATETADLSPTSSPAAALSRTDAQVAFTRPAPHEVSAPGCAPLGTAVLLAGADIHTGPDPTTRTLATVDRKTSVCAGVETQGFGYRVVQLADGTAGFVGDSYL